MNRITALVLVALVAFQASSRSPAAAPLDLSECKDPYGCACADTITREDVGYNVSGDVGHVVILCPFLRGANASVDDFDYGYRDRGDTSFIIPIASSILVPGAPERPKDDLLAPSATSLTAVNDPGRTAAPQMPRVIHAHRNPLTSQTPGVDQSRRGKFIRRLPPSSSPHHVFPARTQRDYTIVSVQFVWVAGLFIVFVRRSWHHG